MKSTLFSFTFLSTSLFAFLPPYLNNHSKKIESLLNTLTLEQKLGQIFMIKISQKEPVEKYKEFIDSYNIGGIFLHGGTSIAEQIKLVNTLQEGRDLPLLVGQDLEWGLAMRLHDAIKFPYALTLGAIQDNELLYKLGAEIARQCKQVGVNINAAPVVDINTNPLNPVIGFRSFGDNKENVAEKACAFLQGLQDHGVLACAKHFPGHGDTSLDSHLTLPVVNHTQERLATIELYPFNAAILAGVGTVMSAHIITKAYDAQRPATLSHSIITGLLKQHLNFKGLCITDSLTMKAISNYYTPVRANMAAFLAGNDILLYAQEIPETIAELKNLIEHSPALEKRLNESVFKILQAKEWIKKHQPLYPLSSTPEAIARINSLQAQQLKQELYRKAITTINNNNFLPLSKNAPVACIQAENTSAGFLNQGRLYNNDIVSYTLTTPAEQEAFLVAPADTQKYVCIIITTPRGKTDESFIAFVNKLHQRTKAVIAVLLGNPYTLSKLDKNISTIIAYETDLEAQKTAANVLFGKEKAEGKLPIMLN